jgi:hypothetical protein
MFVESNLVAVGAVDVAFCFNQRLVKENLELTNLLVEAASQGFQEESIH